MSWSRTLAMTMSLPEPLHTGTSTACSASSCLMTSSTCARERRLNVANSNSKPSLIARLNSVRGSSSAQVIRRWASFLNLFLTVLFYVYSLHAAYSGYRRDGFVIN